MLAVFWLINLRHFLAHRLRSSLSVLGVALGVALILAVSILSASVTASFSELLETIAGKAVIEVSAVSNSGFDEGLLVDVVLVEGVQDAVPMLRGYTTLPGSQGAQKVFLLGFPPDVAKILPDYAAQQATLSDIQVYRAVLLSQDLAAALQVELADPVELLTTQGVQTFELIGLLPKTELERLNQGSLAVMNLPLAQDVLGREGMYDSIYITLKEGVDIDETIARLQVALGDKVLVGRPSFRGKSIEGMLQGLQDTLSVVSVVALFVGMFLIYNTMSVAVLERRREMGLLHALGLTREQIVRAFMIEAGLIGVAGSGLGILLGLLMAKPLVALTASFMASSYPLQTAGVHVSPKTLLLGLFVGLASCLIATFFPAREALTLSPTEALRHREVMRMAHGKRRLSFWVGAGLAGAGVMVGLGYLFLAPQIYLLGLALLAIFFAASLMTPHLVPGCVSLFRGLFSRWGRTVGRLASDNLAQFPARTSVTVGALMISLAMVVALGGATDSFAASVRGAMDSVFGADLYVRSQTWRFSGSDVPLDKDFNTVLEGIEGVSLVVPTRFMLCDWQGQQVILIASDPAKLAQVQRQPLEAGDEQAALAGLSRGDRVIVSSYLADRAGLKMGDHIALASPTGLHSFEIVAISTSYSLGQGVISMSLADLARYWRDQAVDHFAIKLQKGISVEEVKERITRRYAASKQLVVETGRERAKEAAGLADNFLYLFDGLKAVATLVAGLGILNTILVSVLGRTQEIGILRAVGMVKSQVVKMVLYEALAVGLIGGGLGIALGLLLSPFLVRAVQPATGFSIDYVFPANSMATACFIAVMVSLLAAYYPARRAVAVDIVQALRYE